MTEKPDLKPDMKPDLTSLDGIRKTFEERQRSSGKGFHALGDEVLSAYWQAGDRMPKPVSAMTFRNFLQGKTTLRDPTGLELYFRALGAGDDEMRTIVGTLQRALDRRLAMPRTQAAQRAFDGLSLAGMPYSRALVECEVVTRLEDSVAAPLTHLTPREYLLGPDGVEEAGDDPERWGLLQHLDDLMGTMARLDQQLTEGLEAVPESDRARRRVHAAADLREAASVYVHWLTTRPRAGDLLFSRRRFMLHGFFPETERKLAIARAKRVSRIVFGFTDRLARECFAADAREQQLLRTPLAENALEMAAERVFAIINAFYLDVVQGSQGTAAAFHATYQLRSENKGAPLGVGPTHERLISAYEATVRAANHKLEEDVRVPYGELAQIYTDHFHDARRVMLELWQTDYAPHLARQSLSLLLSALHTQGVFDDKRFLHFTKELFTGREAERLRDAQHQDGVFDALLAELK
jgi:hypothetical protein